MRVKPSIEPTEYRQLRTTILTLGYEATLSWSTQSSSPPDTNVAHYPRLMYYYHPDYLGHVEYITDLDGLPYQHFYYTAWGETLLDQKANRPGMNFDSPYRFNGKELDEETGLYYYGARYYSPTVSVWLGVDPLASQFPHQSPYVFTDNNPIMLWDPTGMSAEEPASNPVTTRQLSTVAFEETRTASGAATGSGVDHITHTSSSATSNRNSEGNSVHSTSTFVYNVDVNESGDIDKSTATMKHRMESRSTNARGQVTTEFTEVLVDGFTYEMMPEEFKGVTESYAKDKSRAGKSKAQEWAKVSNIALSTGAGIVVGVATGGTGLALPVAAQVTVGATTSIVSGACIEVSPEMFRFVIFDSGYKRD